MNKKTASTLVEVFEWQNRFNINVWERLDQHEEDIADLYKITETTISNIKKYCENRNIKIVK